MIETNVDHIVLWCTHYPFLIPMIEKILEEKKVWDKITVINPAPAVALQTQRILKTLEQHNEQKKENIFYSTWNEQILENFVVNIISWFETNIQTTLIKKWSIFEHLTLQ
jgi:glutamate racemase